MTSDRALLLAEKLWPKRTLSCSENLEPPHCRVEEWNRGPQFTWKLLASGATWEEVFREASKRVTVQQNLL